MRHALPATITGQAARGGLGRQKNGLAQKLRQQGHAVDTLWTHRPEYCLASPRSLQNAAKGNRYR